MEKEKLSHPRAQIPKPSLPGKEYPAGQGCPRRGNPGRARAARAQSRSGAAGVAARSRHLQRRSRHGTLRGRPTRAEARVPDPRGARLTGEGDGRGRRKKAKGTSLGSAGNQEGGGQIPGLDLSLDPTSC